MGAYSELARAGYGKLSPVEFSLYAYLLAYAERQGWPSSFRLSAAWLKKAIGITGDIVLKKAREKLQGLGLISTERDGGKLIFKVPPPKNLKDEPKDLRSEPKNLRDEPKNLRCEPKNLTTAYIDNNTNIGNTPPLLGTPENLRIAPQNLTHPPTLAEVEEYIKTAKMNVNAAMFHAYYETRCWRDTSGKPVRDWRALLGAWQRKDDQNGRTTGNTYAAKGKEPTAEDYRNNHW